MLGPFNNLRAGRPARFERTASPFKIDFIIKIFILNKMRMKIAITKNLNRAITVVLVLLSISSLICLLYFQKVPYKNSYPCQWTGSTTNIDDYSINHKFLLNDGRVTAVTTFYHFDYQNNSNYDSRLNLYNTDTKYWCLISNEDTFQSTNVYMYRPTRSLEIPSIIFSQLFLLSFVGITILWGIPIKNNKPRTSRKRTIRKYKRNIV
jgi:hypothetical protein